MKRTLAALLTFALLLVMVHRLPAPITEESPTPAPEQSAKPKRTITKRQTPSPQSKSQATINQNRFEGAWRGTLNLGTFGNVDYTLVINAAGTIVNETTSVFSPKTYPATCEGNITKWHPPSGQTWTFTPLRGGETGLVTAYAPGFLGVGAYNTTATFHKVSP